jgi:lipopolysaccharide transport system ATP-binding protein
MEEVGKSGRTVLFVSHNVPSVLRLCDRVILLEHGVVAADGRPADVVGRYLSSDSGSPAERMWPELEHAPGDDVARIRGVRVLNQSGGVTETVDVGDAFFLEVEYWKLQGPRRPIAALQIFNEEGLCLFATSAFGTPCEAGPPSDVSVVRARCKIPAHLLAEGRVFVLAALVSYSPDVFHALERDIVSFQVVDRRNADAVREHYAGHWPGVVRPKLEWEVRIEPAS